MNVKIRNAKDNDIPEILELLYQLDRPKPIDDEEIKIFRDKIKDYFLDSDKKILVAEIDSRVIGAVSMVILRRLNRAKFEMYIPELVITKELRYSGIGKKIIAHCINLAKERNCYRIRLESGNQRKESHKFYTSLGFDQSSLSFSKNVF